MMWSREVRIRVQKAGKYASFTKSNSKTQSFVSEGSQKIPNVDVQRAMDAGRQCSYTVSNQLSLHTKYNYTVHTCMTLCVLSVLSEEPHPPMYCHVWPFNNACMQVNYT